MVSVDEIEMEIRELETRETTYAVCERLCWLYTVRDHLIAKRVQDAPAAVVGVGGTEFLDEVAGRDISGVLRVVDEHMQAVRVVQPREYEAVMAKIRNV